MYQFLRKTQGITLIELLLVIALIALIGTGAAPVFSRFLVQNYLTNKTNEVVFSLRTAQSNSIGGKGDSRWGVNISSTAITLYRGNTYATRNTTFDQTYTIPSSITITATDVAFNKVTGAPTSAVTITISSSAGSRTVTMNALGVINVN